ncbi:MAG: haloacid dehalogenase [Armatimonadetes bacterium]|nr:haloacid dehalogenase [Armatimonadota bacterium]
MDNSVGRIAEELRGLLDETNQVREDALKLSRETVRLSANSIRASHREDFDEACELKALARKKVEETRNILKDKLEIYYTGYVQDAQKEYAESELTYAIIREMPFPELSDLGVEAPAYLNGLAEAIGESRRHVLDVMRHGDLDRAERILGIMDEVYYVLITFDYPDAVTQGLRRQTDMVRGVLERTRADITLLLQQRKLETAIETAMERIGPEEGIGNRE